MKKKYPGRRLVALFEPRTNTTVRNFFQDELSESFAAADVALFTPLYRLEKIPVEERLSIFKVADKMKKMGIKKDNPC